ncbi:unnamed protein product, partial [Brassica rapa subsp. narinosa]
SHIASGTGRTALAMWRAGWDEPRSPYGVQAGTNRARNMASGPGRTALTIWRVGRDGPRSPSWSGRIKIRLPSDDDGFRRLFSQGCLSKRLDFSI